MSIYCPSTGFASKMPMFYVSDDNIPQENVKFAIERLEVKLSAKEIKLLRGKLYQKSFTTHGSDLGGLFDSINKQHDGQITLKELSDCVVKILRLRRFFRRSSGHRNFSGVMMGFVIHYAIVAHPSPLLQKMNSVISSFVSNLYFKTSF